MKYSNRKDTQKGSLSLEAFRQRLFSGDGRKSAPTDVGQLPNLPGMPATTRDVYWQLHPQQRVLNRRGAT